MTTTIQAAIGTRLLLALTMASASGQAVSQTPVGDTPTTARTVSGDYISWREHIIDDPVTAGVNFSGSDGFVMGDIDKDGFEDIVSVHESDAEYDSGSFLEDFVPPVAGHVRVHFGSSDPFRGALLKWSLVGGEAGRGVSPSHLHTLVSPLENLFLK